MGTRTVEIISGGTVVHEHGAIRGDVIIREGRIVGLVEDSTGLAGERLDVSGKWVLPGGVDIHTHLREPSQHRARGFRPRHCFGCCRRHHNRDRDASSRPAGIRRREPAHKACARGAGLDRGLRALCSGNGPEPRRIGSSSGRRGHGVQGVHVRLQPRLSAPRRRHAARVSGFDART